MLCALLVCTCLFASAQSMCYKYEPLYRNWTGSTSLSLVKIATDDICRKASQCSPNQDLRTGSSEFCPVEILKPQPAPTISHRDDDKKFYMNNLGGISVNELKFSTASEQSYRSYMKEPTLQKSEPSKTTALPIFTAMCFLADDWSSMCPRDSNITNDETIPDRPTMPLQYCYVMQRHEVDDDGICNITLAPNEILMDLLKDETERRNTPSRNLVLFRINPTDEKCYVSNSTSMTSAEIDRCFPEDEKFEPIMEPHQPTCELRENFVDNSTLKFDYSLRSIFAGLNRFQCGAV